jgi:putative resolvase
MGVNLSEWAGRAGVSKFTGYRWFREGTLPVPVKRVGRLILVNGGVAEREPARAVLYARVSPDDQRGDLGRQVARLAGWAAGQGVAAAAGAGPGMNGKRRRLARLLAVAAATTVVVEHRDRLARFGARHLEVALPAQGRRIAVVDAGEAGDDLIGDMSAVLTSFCARLYGRPGARNRAVRALCCAGCDGGPVTAGP